jgi:hypothetical protein
MLPFLRLWVLHHLHLAIAIDATLHTLTIGLSALAVVWTFKLIKLVKNHTNTTRGALIPAYCMAPIVLFFVFTTIRSFYACAIHYHQWWNR